MGCPGISSYGSDSDVKEHKFQNTDLAMILFLFFKMFYLFLREREHERERDKEGGGQRI